MATDTAPPTAIRESDTITLPVPPELARAYRDAPPDEQRKWHLVVEFSLRALMNATPESLLQLMDDIGRKAREAGLTEAELNDILAESDDEGGR
ncbi:MAG TPA: hypothetical protein VFG68_06935 [Fimbriiglobus sp.]|nr:hypothetical protein [Fimbriiglobus sp.]